MRRGRKRNSPSSSESEDVSSDENNDNDLNFESSSEESEEKEDDIRAWGKSSANYIGQEEYDSDDEELAEEELKEAKELQKRRAALLQPEDFEAVSKPKTGKSKKASSEKVTTFDSLHLAILLLFSRDYVPTIRRWKSLVLKSVAWTVYHRTRS